MALYLVRHGEAKGMLEDPACPLTERGEDAVRRMAEWAARSGVRVEQIRHSGKLRARQTAELLAQRLDPPDGVIAIPGIQPNDEPERVADALREQNAPVMLVSHLPFLGRLTSILIEGSAPGALIRFQPAEMVCLSRSSSAWSVHWVMSPDLL
jgi:phosphohistidine phosphatase